MRKKLFAILMSAMMMVTFMPSMAFATTPWGNTVNYEPVASTIDTAHPNSLSKTSDVVPATCGEKNAYVKHYCECGDYYVSYDDAKDPHQGKKETHVMEAEEAEELVVSTVSNWVADLVAKNGVITPVGNEKYLDTIVKFLAGITEGDETAARIAGSKIWNAIKAFQTGWNQEDNLKLLRALISTVNEIVYDYLHEVKVLVGVYQFNESKLDHTFCRYIVETCAGCGDVLTVRGILHEMPEIAACATSYECAHCHKTIHFAHTNGFQDDVATIIRQAKTLADTIKEKGFGKQDEAPNADPVTDEFRTLANELFFFDANSGHDYQLAVEEKACGKVYTLTCSKCNDVKSFTLPTAVKHNYEWKELVAADCSTGLDGLKVQKCADCGAINLLSFTPVQPKHSYVEKTFEATCTLPGYTVEVCENCNKVVPITSKNWTKPTGHDYYAEMVVPSACGCDGLLKIGCKNCTEAKYYVADAQTGDSLEDVAYPIADLGDVNQLKDVFNFFSNGNGIVGIKDKLHDATTYYFVGWGLDFTKPIELTNPTRTADHKYNNWGIVSEPDCEHGTIWGAKCSNCGKITDKHVETVEESNKLGHTPETVTVPATCGEAAYHFNYCTVCGKYLDDKGNTMKKNKTELFLDPATNILVERAAKVNDEVVLVDVVLDEAKIYETGSKPVVAKGVKCVPADEWTVLKDSTFTTVGTRVKKCQKCGSYCDSDDIAVKKLAKAYQPTLKAGKKSFKATFKKVGKAASGVQVAYKVKGANNYKYKKTTNKTSLTVKGLKSGKKYAVKVRKFVKEDGKTIYGKWCAVKYVTVK